MKVTEREVRELISEEPKFFNIYLYIHQADKQYPALSEKYKNTEGAYVNKDRYITTGLEVIEENGWEEDLGYLVPEPTKDHLVRKTFVITAKSIEIDNIILMGHDKLDYMHVINNYIEDNQLVVIGVPENEILEAEILKYPNQYLPLACSRRTIIISGLENDINELLKPYICYERERNKN